MSLSGRVSRWVGGAACAVGMLALAPAVAQAQTPLPQPGSFEVTPFIGLGFGGDTDGSTLALGAAGSYNFTTNLAIEAELSILPDTVGDTDLIDTKVTTFSANGVYHFDTGGIVLPYATLGLGFGHVGLKNRTLELDEGHTELAVNLGGGVKANVAERIQVRGDLRYFNINDVGGDYWRVYGGVVFKFDR